MRKKLYRARHVVSLALALTLLVSWFALPRGFWNWIEPTAFAGTTFTVNSAADTDDGLCTAINCTLRQAINASNNSIVTRDANLIVFNIPGTGVKTINVVSTGLGALPTITRQVIIDGYTQGVAHPNTLAVGNDAVLLIELNGGSLGLMNGLVITASNCTVKGLVINRFRDSGIRLENSSGSTIQGNYIGTNVSGTADLGNSGNGIFIAISSSSIIGGTMPGERNIISGNDLSGIGILFSGGIQIQGNYIGADKNGTAALGNSTGVGLLASPGNIIGGTTGTTLGGPCTGACNLISGNSGTGPNGNGIVITDSGATLNWIRGNYIGTDVNGTADLGNSGDGVFIDNAPNNTIGRNDSADDIRARNVISGNGFGIRINGSGATGTTVAGNYIGTTSSGAAFSPIGGFGSGVTIDSAGNNAIGLPGAGNVISGNLNGIIISGSTATNNTIKANYIGTDATGTVGVGNQGSGIVVQTANNTIGGTTSPERNIISGNAGGGVNINSGAAGNKVLGNYIGTKADGAGALGNAHSRLLLATRASLSVC